MLPRPSSLRCGRALLPGVMKLLAIDLFCGLGGWAEGFLAEGYDVIGFDVERHDYGTGGYPGQLVLQDVLTLHGRQFRDAAVIVASPPCQAYSYRAMPWKRAKALPPPSNELFDACFRLQREASEAAGRYIPLLVENVKGAQPWVGRAAWHYGSYYLWGDVPALMPWTGRAQKQNPDGTNHGQGSWFAVADSKNRGSQKNNGGSWFAIGSPGQKELSRNPVHEGVKTVGHVNIRDGHTHTRHLTNQSESDAVKQYGSGAAWFDKALDERRKAASAGRKVGGDWFGTYAEEKAAGTISPTRVTGKNTSARKAASALIAKIPFPLAQHIAQVYKPRG